jgi:5-methylcytosine-specific restriction endonuclease McrA
LLAARAKAIAIKSTATRTRGLAFTIDIDVAAGLILGDCRYCGTNDLEVLCVEGHGHTATPINGLDRVDSSRGYHLDNVVTACKRCNVSKSDLTLEEFKKHVETMYRYLRATGWQVSPTE